MSKNDISITEVDVKRDGIDEVFDRLLLQMDCTLYEGTYRQAQTVDFHYTYEVTKAIPATGHEYEYVVVDFDFEELFARNPIIAEPSIDLDEDLYGDGISDEDDDLEGLDISDGNPFE